MQLYKHPLAVLTFGLLSILFSLSLYSSWKRNVGSSAQVARLEEEVAQTQRQIESLSEQAKIATSSGAQEKIIRDQLLMQKEGEVVLQIPEITKESLAPPSPSPSPTVWEEWRAVLSQ